MFNIPEKYKTDLNINMKDFIPKELKPEQKRRIKEAVRSARLSYQIVGEEIASVIDSNYHCQVIQCYDMELTSIKETAFIANIYQNAIKSLCIIHMRDSQNEVYSLALKRLSQQDRNQIVVNESVMTEQYPIGLPSSARERLSSYVQYESICNKSNKVNFYKEIYEKIYLLMNEKSYSNTAALLKDTVWYDAEQADRMFSYYKELVEKRNMVKKAATNAEKVKLNQDIKAEIQILNSRKY